MKLSDMAQDLPGYDCGEFGDAVSMRSLKSSKEVWLSRGEKLLAPSSKALRAAGFSSLRKRKTGISRNCGGPESAGEVVLALRRDNCCLDVCFCMHEAAPRVYCSVNGGANVWFGRGESAESVRDKLLLLTEGK